MLIPLSRMHICGSFPRMGLGKLKKNAKSFSSEEFKIHTHAHYTFTILE